eukprot:152561-Prymnesium_polylepis.1
MARWRALQVACAILVPAWCVLAMDFKQNGNEDHIFSAVRRGFWSWFDNYVELDVRDVRKARSVGGQLPEAPVPRPARQPN